MKAATTVVVLTTGKQDRGMRATLAFAWACTALALGKEVSLYMTMDGTVWAAKGASDGVIVQGFEALDEYEEQFSDLGGKLLVCAPCTEYYCGFDRSLISQTLRPEAELAGLSSIVGMADSEATVVTF